MSAKPFDPVPEVLICCFVLFLFFKITLFVFQSWLFLLLLIFTDLFCLG